MDSQRFEAEGMMLATEGRGRPMDGKVFLVQHGYDGDWRPLAVFGSEADAERYAERYQREAAQAWYRWHDPATGRPFPCVTMVVPLPFRPAGVKEGERSEAAYRRADG